MRFLIDGYNLLHQSPLMQTGEGAAWLRQQRLRLVAWLAAHLSEEERRATMVVFDAHDPPSDSTRDGVMDGIRVAYAHDVAEADDLIERWIDRHPNPQQLTVVSSDRRLKQAARRRRAKPIDAREWFDAIAHREPRAASNASPDDPKAQGLSGADAAAWMEMLGWRMSPSSNPAPPPPQAPPVPPQATQPPEISASELASMDDPMAGLVDVRLNPPPTRRKPLP